MEKEIVIYYDDAPNILEVVQMSTDQYYFIQEESIKYNCELGTIESPNIILKKRSLS